GVIFIPVAHLPRNVVASSHRWSGRWGHLMWFAVIVPKTSSGDLLNVEDYFHNALLRILGVQLNSMCALAHVLSGGLESKDVNPHDVGYFVLAPILSKKSVRLRKTPRFCPY